MNVLDDDHAVECDAALGGSGRGSCTCGAIVRRTLADVEGAVAQLPASERAAYDRCQRSVVDARAAAPGNEGLRVVV